MIDEAPKPLSKSCPKCGKNLWHVVNGKDIYGIFCTDCMHEIIFMKKNEVRDNFICKKCGSKNCQQLESMKFLVFECKDCEEHFRTVHKEIRPTIDYLTYPEDPNEGLIVRPDPKKPKPPIQPRPSNQLHCPKCGSTAVAIGKRGFSLLTGMLGANQTVNRCGKCGHSWKPGR